MSFFKNIIRYINIKRINRAIRSYKYVHIMYNDKFINPFVQFMNNNFNNDEHLFLIQNSALDEKVAPFPKAKNVLKISRLKGLNFGVQNIDKLIFHSLFGNDWVDYLYENKDLLNKSYWVIWGGDLYNAPKDEKNDYVRRNFKGYIACVEGDEILAKKRFNSNAILFSAPYTTPITKSMLDNVSFNKKEYINIQINNSCDVSTLEMLDILAKFKNENIKITTILSYGKLKFKDEIIKKGKEIYGEKFEYINNYLSPKNYAQHIANLDIIIFNQNRQQGVGNALASAYYGKKIFIKSTVTSVQYLHNLGIEVYDTNSIKNLSFSEFISIPDNCKIKNQESAKKYYDDSLLVKKWSQVFNNKECI